MAKTTDYNKRLVKQLKNPLEASAYLNAALEERDVPLFLKALGKVAEAHGGMTRLAEKTKFSRVGLYKMFSDRGNPELKTIEDILKTLHLRLAIQPEKSTTHRRAA